MQPTKPFSEMLDQAIRDSGKTLKQISDECRHYGVNIDATSLSKMRTGEQGPPPPKAWGETIGKTEVLAKVLGLDEERFPLLAGLEQTPPAVVQQMDAISSALTEHNRTSMELYDTLADLGEWTGQHLTKEQNLAIAPIFDRLVQTRHKLISSNILIHDILDFFRVHTLRATNPGTPVIYENPPVQDETFLVITRGLASIMNIPVQPLRAFVWALQASLQPPADDAIVKDGTDMGIKERAVTELAPHGNSPR